MSTVLYIEDHPSNLVLIERIIGLLAPHARLVTATTAREGLKIAHLEQPTLVLLDLGLPDMPGECVIEALRADKQLARTRIAVLSADATEQRRKRVFGLGADVYLVKPFDLDQFVDLLSS